MLEIKQGTLEIVDNEDIKKIKCESIDGTYIEARVKNGSLDIRASKDIGGSMRRLYCEKVNDDISIKEMMKRMEQIFE